MSYSRFSMGMARQRYLERLDEDPEAHREGCPVRDDPNDIGAWSECDCAWRAEQEYVERLWEDRRG